MTRKLQDLVDEWEEERQSFKRVEKRFLRAVGVFSELNRLIYAECVKEGIDIKTLNLNKE